VVPSPVLVLLLQNSQLLLFQHHLFVPCVAGALQIPQTVVLLSDAIMLSLNC
jgi:hypothetical protein